MMKKHISIKNPSIIFLQETKYSSITLANLSQKFWKHSQAISRDAQGEAGGLAILRKSP
jgi:hypothetical protein